MTIMKHIVLLCILAFVPSANLMAAPITHPVPAIQDTETNAQREARLAWWRAARFGMFIHWGMYAQRPPGAAGEWIMHNSKISVAEYKADASHFNPQKFDPDAWVMLAKDAGMKYIVITTKHHDGFAMFDSKADPFNIVDATPYKHDPLKDLADACKRHGMKLGFYYSQDQDWTAPGGAAYGGDWDPAQKGSFADYLDKKAIPQLTELLNNYKPYPSIIWFDFPTPDMTPQLASKIVALLNRYPNLIWNDRLGGGYEGDSVTPEQSIPPQGYPGKDWETCMTISDNWAYRWNEQNYKSTETLLHNLVDIASKGGNYLLNVGPDADGVIPQPEVDRLRQIGVWMRANGDSIYGTSRSPLISLPDNERMTVKGDTYYLHVFGWTTGSASLPGLDSPVESATTLIDHQKLTVAKDFDGVTTVSLPSHPDPLDTVVVLKLGGPLKVSDVPLQANPDGSFTLSAEKAKLSDGLVLQGRPSNIGYWTKQNLRATWYIRAPSDGSYTVELVYACTAGAGGSTFDISSPTSKVSGSVAETGANWNTYTTMTLPGTLHLDSGAQILTIAATSMPHGAVMNLRSISLIPAK